MGRGRDINLKEEAGIYQSTTDDNCTTCLFCKLRPFQDKIPPKKHRVICKRSHYIDQYGKDRESSLVYVYTHKFICKDYESMDLYEYRDEELTKKYGND